MTTSGARALAGRVRRRLGAGPSAPPAAPPFDRRRYLLAEISQTMKLIEIGPSYNPLVPRSEGWNVLVVDHASRSELVAKYRLDESVDTARIEDVDVVWSGGTLAEAIPSEHHRTIDAVIASHVIEHMPNPVGFLRSLDQVLSPGGFAMLAVPDMRACFDVLRSPTTAGELVEAHVTHAERHALRALFDQSAHGALRSAQITWNLESRGSLEYIQGFEHAAELLSAFRPGADVEYVDCHAWQFTPASFELVMLELNALGLSRLEITAAKPTRGCEFFVKLRRMEHDPPAGAALDERRLATQRRALAELGRMWARLDEESG